MNETRACLMREEEAYRKAMHSLHGDPRQINEDNKANKIKAGQEII